METEDQSHVAESRGQNTSYFHYVSHTRRIRSTLTSIQDGHGVIQRGHGNIAMVATKYFDTLYTSQADISTRFPRSFKASINGYGDE